MPQPTRFLSLIGFACIDAEFRAAFLADPVGTAARYFDLDTLTFDETMDLNQLAQFGSLEDFDALPPAFAALEGALVKCPNGNCPRTKLVPLP